MADEIMDSEARERLIRLETINVEQNRRLDRVIELAEAIARMQEREAARDSKINVLFGKLDTHAIEIDKLKRAKNWGAGVLAVITAILLPLAGYALHDSYQMIANIDRRLIGIEARLNIARTATP